MAMLVVMVMVRDSGDGGDGDGENTVMASVATLVLNPRQQYLWRRLLLAWLVRFDIISEYRTYCLNPILPLIIIH